MTTDCGYAKNLRLDSCGYNLNLYWYYVNNKMTGVIG